MSGRAFFDSNILVYAYGPSDLLKSRTAQRLIVSTAAAEKGVVSYQVIQEFLNVASKKFHPPLPLDVIRGYLREIVSSLEILPWSMDLMQSGLAIAARYKFSWYDSLIVAAAIQSGCATLYTEDLQSGQTIDGLTIVNPFLADLPLK